VPDKLISITGRPRKRTLRRPLTRLGGVAVAVGLVAGSAASAGAASASRTDVLHSVPRYYLALTTISKHSGRLGHPQHPDGREGSHHQAAPALHDL
jgi:hypothetical protein